MNFTEPLLIGNYTRIYRYAFFFQEAYLIKDHQS